MRSTLLLALVAGSGALRLAATGLSGLLAAPARSGLLAARGRSGLLAARGRSGLITCSTVSTLKVLVPIGEGSEEIETACIQDVLVRAGAAVTVASVMPSVEVNMSRGLRILADCTIDSCVDTAWDVIACPGGMPGEILSLSLPHLPLSLSLSLSLSLTLSLLAFVRPSDPRRVTDLAFERI